jgi:hypothetical protein
VLDASLFPRTQKNLLRRKSSLRLAGDAAAINGVTIHIHSTGLGQDITAKTDANGMIAGTVAMDPLAKLNGSSVFDALKLAIQPGDNPQLVKNDQLDLSGVSDVLTFFEYSFDYR